MRIATPPLLTKRYTYKQLVLMHEHPDPKALASGGDSCADDAGDGEAGWVRYDRYQDLTIRAFGPRAGRWALLPFQAAVIIGISITYTVVGGDDLRAIVADYAPASTPPAWACYAAFGGGFGFLGLQTGLGVAVAPKLRLQRRQLPVQEPKQS